MDYLKNKSAVWVPSFRSFLAEVMASRKAIFTDMWIKECEEFKQRPY